MLAYYFLPFIGINVPAMVAAIVAISLCEGAYLAEILCGGFLGIPKGQLEATQLLGFSRFDTLVHIEIPQALKLTTDRTSTRLNSSHKSAPRMPSSDC